MTCTRYVFGADNIHLAKKDYERLIKTLSNNDDLCQRLRLLDPPIRETSDDLQKVVFVTACKKRKGPKKV